MGWGKPRRMSRNLSAAFWPVVNYPGSIRRTGYLWCTYTQLVDFCRPLGIELTSYLSSTLLLIPFSQPWGLKLIDCVRKSREYHCNKLCAWVEASAGTVSKLIAHSRWTRSPAGAHGVRHTCIRSMVDSSWLFMVTVYLISPSQS